MLNTGLLLLNDALWPDGPDEPAGEIMLQVHDSVVVQCKPEVMAWVCTTIKQCLERPIDITGCDNRTRTCKIPCDLQVGWNWDELAKISTPFTTVPERKVGVNATQ